MSFQATTSQTVGPFFQIGLARFYVDDLTVPGAAGQPVEFAGRVFDGDGQPVPDAVIEIWQADAHGKYPHPEDAAENDPQKPSQEPAFRGYGRVPTADDGSFRFKTIKPGRVLAPDGTPQAPHLDVSIFMRGLLRRLVTRIYFPEDVQAHDQDFALKLVESARRETLIAKKSNHPGGHLEWNVFLQGPNETVFFDF